MGRIQDLTFFFDFFFKLSIHFFYLSSFSLKNDSFVNLHPINKEDVVMSNAPLLLPHHISTKKMETD